MFDVRLKKTEKSQIFVLVQQSGLNPADFEWSDAESVEWIDIDSVQFRVSVLTHRPTEYFCKFGGSRMEYSPGPDQREETEKHRDRWAVKSGVTEVWLEELRKEVDAPDLWASIGEEKVLSTAAASANLDNRPFTVSDQTLIAAKLDEIKEYLLESQQFAADQAETIERQFQYLRESSERLGRKDWLNALIGALMGQVINLALSPEIAKGLLVLAATSFQPLWNVAQRYLQ